MRSRICGSGLLPLASSRRERARITVTRRVPGHGPLAEKENVSSLEIMLTHCLNRTFEGRQASLRLFARRCCSLHHDGVRKHASRSQVESRALCAFMETETEVKFFSVLHGCTEEPLFRADTNQDINTCHRHPLSAPVVSVSLQCQKTFKRKVRSERTYSSERFSEAESFHEEAWTETHTVYQDLIRGSICKGLKMGELQESMDDANTNSVRDMGEGAGERIEAQKENNGSADVSVIKEYGAAGPDTGAEGSAADVMKASNVQPILPHHVNGISMEGEVPHDGRGAVGGVEGLSKNAQKRLAKAAKAKEHNAYRKELRKEKRKKEKEERVGRPKRQRLEGDQPQHSGGAYRRGPKSQSTNPSPLKLIFFSFSFLATDLRAR